MRFSRLFFASVFGLGLVVLEPAVASARGGGDAGLLVDAGALDAGAEDAGPRADGAAFRPAPTGVDCALAGDVAGAGTALLLAGAALSIATGSRRSRRRGPAVRR